MKRFYILSLLFLATTPRYSTAAPDQSAPSSTIKKNTPHVCTPCSYMDATPLTEASTAPTSVDTKATPDKPAAATVTVAHKGADRTAERKKMKEDFAHFVSRANKLMEEVSEFTAAETKQLAQEMQTALNSFTTSTKALAKKKGKQVAQSGADWLETLSKSSRDFFAEAPVSLNTISYTIDDSSKYYVIKADLTGFNPDSIKVITTKDATGEKSVTIKAVQEIKREESRTNDDGSTVKETYYEKSNKSQQLALPPYVNIDDYSTKFDHSKQYEIKFKKIAQAQ